MGRGAVSGRGHQHSQACRARRRTADFPGWKHASRNTAQPIPQKASCLATHKPSISQRAACLAGQCAAARQMAPYVANTAQSQTSGRYASRRHHIRNPQGITTNGSASRTNLGCRTSTACEPHAHLMNPVCTTSRGIPGNTRSPSLPKGGTHQPANCPPPPTHTTLSPASRACDPQAQCKLLTSTTPHSPHQRKGLAPHHSDGRAEDIRVCWHVLDAPPAMAHTMDHRPQFARRHVRQAHRSPSLPPHPC